MNSSARLPTTARNQKAKRPSKSVCQSMHALRTLLGESASGLIECCVTLRVVRNQVFGAKQQEALGANLFKL